MPPRWVNNPFAPPVTPLDFSRRLETGKQSSQGSNDVVNPNLTFPSPTFRIERIGSASVTIPLNGQSAQVNVTLTPALSDTVLANYKVFTGVDDPTAITSFVMGARLTTTTNLIVRIGRNLTQAASAITSLAVSGNPLTDVSGMALTPIPNPTTVSDTHGQNPFFNHAHDTVGHPVTDPGHTHNLSTAAAAVTVVGDWVIMHI